jgi:C4-dicarboxylate-specific signal transduction histidine kinase
MSGREEPVLDPGVRVVARPSSLVHLEILRSVAEAVNRSLDLDEVVDKSLQALTHVTGHEIASLHLVSPDRERLLLRGDRGLSDRLREINLVLPMGEGLIGRVAQTGIPRRLDEAREAEDLLPAAREIVRADGIRGFVCVAIRARHRILGTLSLGRQTAKRFNDEEFMLLECTADQIGLALDNARLYGETRRQIEELQRAQVALVRAERLAAVGELAAGVAHEINNPLMIILAQAHLLMDAETSPEVQKGLRLIDSATKRTASIVRDLMLFAEPAPAQRSPTSIPDQVRRVLAVQEPRLRADQIEVKTEFEDVAPVWVDGPQLQDVLVHTIRNAHQAMVTAHNGGTLILRVRAIDDGVRVEIEDDGPGIPPEHLPRIFTPFFTTKGPSEGRGLGLSVAHAIIAEHGGRLWAENRPQGGAVLFLELPAGAPAAEPPP